MQVEGFEQCQEREVEQGWLKIYFFKKGNLDYEYFKVNQINGF